VQASLCNALGKTEGTGKMVCASNVFPSNRLENKTPQIVTHNSPRNVVLPMCSYQIQWKLKTPKQLHIILRGMKGNPNDGTLISNIQLLNLHIQVQGISNEKEGFPR
jgi:hypothetical protein